MDDIYYQKYLKYKNKYLSLKKADIDDQYAGAKIKVLWKVSVIIKHALRQSDEAALAAVDFSDPRSIRNAPKRLTKYLGKRGQHTRKIIEFGTVTDRRSRVVDGKTITETVTNPYFRLDGKIYEIITYTNFWNPAKTPQDIIKLIEAKDLEYFKTLTEFSFYERPCHSIYAGSNRFCNENRSLVKMSFENGEYHRDYAPYTVQ